MEKSNLENTSISLPYLGLLTSVGVSAKTTRRVRIVDIEVTHEETRAPMSQVIPFKSIIKCEDREVQEVRAMVKKLSVENRILRARLEKQTKVDLSHLGLTDCHICLIGKELKGVLGIEELNARGNRFSNDGREQLRHQILGNKIGILYL